MHNQVVIFEELFEMNHLKLVWQLVFHEKTLHQAAMLENQILPNNNRGLPCSIDLPFQQV